MPTPLPKNLAPPTILQTQLLLYVFTFFGPVHAALHLLLLNLLVRQPPPAYLPSTAHTISLFPSLSTLPHTLLVFLPVLSVHLHRALLLRGIMRASSLAHPAPHYPTFHARDQRAFTSSTPHQRGGIPLLGFCHSSSSGRYAAASFGLKPHEDHI